MSNKCRFLSVLLLGAVSLGCNAETVVHIHQVTPEGIGAQIGTVTLGESPEGVKFKPDIQELTPGEHGFHVHEFPSCEALEKDGKKIPALAAGGHYDPEKTGRHEGPAGQGHKGDLPKLIVNERGVASEPVIAPRLTLKELSGRSLMIHAGGDNYSDNPPMGGGGARIACGVIQ